MTVTCRHVLSLCMCLILAVSTNAYTPSKPTKNAAFLKPSVATSIAAAALSVLLVTNEPAFANSNLAAQIRLDSIPPTSVQVNIRDLPLVGEILSGTYLKVSEPISNPSLTISSPKDKIGAIKSAATNGHLEFDVNGLLGTHLDIDVSAEEAGVARVRIASPLIPQLPFKNPAASAPAISGKDDSEWFVVTNLGSGSSYYFNQATGETQYKKPKVL
jgi:hypothetical protein